MVSAEVGWHWREDYARLHDGTLDETYERRPAALAGPGDLAPDTRLRDRLRALVPDVVLPEQLAKVFG